MEKEEKDIELRCEEVQEILTRPPHALVRWGITVFFTVLALFFIGGCFFKYPDVVSAEITVTTEHPPVWIVARGNGKIKEVYGKDREQVKVGKIIAVLENPAETKDVLLLEKILQDFCLTDSCIHSTVFPEQLALGSVQAAYATFIKSLTDYRNFLSLDLYEQKIEATRKELQEYRNYIKHLNRQDVVSAEITVTTEHPPVWIVARGNGKIKEVYGKDREQVKVGKIIAVLENPAETKDVLLLEKILQDFCLTDSCIHSTVFPEQLALGSVQAAYATFIKSLTDYRNFLSLDLYEQKIEATRKELQEYRNYIKHLNRQAELDKEQVRIAETVHSREKKLFGEGLTAQSDYEEAKQAFLNKQQGQEQMMTSLSSAKIQEAQLQQNILETQMERSREANNLVATLKAAYDELQVGIEDWKMTCLFISPANGILSYNDVWQKNQNVNSGDKVFSIVASQTGDIIGKIKLPVNGSGKVKPGQRVNISVTGYPYMEFGFLTGKVVSVSLLTDDKSMYTVTVSLPQDLQTSYGKVLEFKGELTGIAEVMTDERSVTGRLFGPLRYLWEKYLS